MSTASTSSAPRVDIYTRVTNRIVEQLEQGMRPWMQPWNAATQGKDLHAEAIARTKADPQLAPNLASILQSQVSISRVKVRCTRVPIELVYSLGRIILGKRTCPHALLPRPRIRLCARWVRVVSRTQNACERTP